LASIALLSSCAKVKQDRLSKEYAAHYLQAQQDFCSTNILVAERGVIDFRQWLLDSKNPCEPWMNRDLAIFHVDARLFLIKERLDETNMADYFYYEGIEAYDRYLRYLQSLHLPASPHPLEPISSKEKLRDYLARQEKGLDVGWMTEAKGSVLEK